MAEFAFMSLRRIRRGAAGSSVNALTCAALACTTLLPLGGHSNEDNYGLGIRKIGITSILIL